MPPNTWHVITLVSWRELLRLRGSFWYTLELRTSVAVTLCGSEPFPIHRSLWSRRQGRSPTPAYDIIWLHVQIQMHEMHGCWPLTKNKMSCRDTIQHCTVNEFLCPKSKSPDTVAYALLRLCFCWLTFTACCMKLGSPTKQKEELLKTPSRNLLTIFVTLSDMVYDKKTSLNSTFSKSPLRSVPLSWISWWSIAPLDSCGSVWVKRGIMRKGLQVMRRKQFSFELVCITFSHWVSTHLY